MDGTGISSITKRKPWVDPAEIKRLKALADQRRRDGLKPLPGKKKKPKPRKPEGCIYWKGARVCWDSDLFHGSRVRVDWSPDMDAPLSLKGVQTSPASKRGVRKKGPGLYPLASAFWREGMVMDGPHQKTGYYLVKYDDAPARWTDLRHVRFDVLRNAARIVLMPDHVHHHEGGLMNDTKHYFAHGKTSPEKRRGDLAAGDMSAFVGGKGCAAGRTIDRMEALRARLQEVGASDDEDSSGDSDGFGGILPPTPRTIARRARRNERRERRTKRWADADAERDAAKAARGDVSVWDAPPSKMGEGGLIGGLAGIVSSALESKK